MTQLKAFRLDKKLTLKLSQLAVETKRSEKYFVEEALRHYFADYEDAMIAKERFDNPKSKYITPKELKQRLGI